MVPEVVVEFHPKPYRSPLLYDEAEHDADGAA